MYRSNHVKLFEFTLVVTLCLQFIGQMTHADFEFGAPTGLGPTVNSVGHFDGAARTSQDELSLYFHSTRPRGVSWDADIWVCHRASRKDDWGPAQRLGAAINTTQADGTPWLSADGLELYFYRGQVQAGVANLHVSRRHSPQDPWGQAERLGPTVNSAALDTAPSLTADGLELYFSSNRSGVMDLYVCKRATTSEPWGVATSLGPKINTTHQQGNWSENSPIVSPDGLTLFFSSVRPEAGRSGVKAYMTRRDTRQSPWHTPVLLDIPTTLSAPVTDVSGDAVYFAVEEAPFLRDIWQIKINPIVDFTGDLHVGIEDLALLIEHWGQSNSAYDIGPAPLGDGFVDAADLEVLMSYYGQNVDRTLLAHWKLDELGGTTARDSALFGGQKNDAAVLGTPIWSPSEGAVGGAISLDGMDDYLRTPMILDPGNGPFSVFAWVKGGAAGQVILSQEDGANWLMADPIQGAPMTTLTQSSRGADLTTGMSVTDGDWHRVGLVWDGSERSLYVDDIEVARDLQRNLPSRTGDLFLGAGKNLEPGSYWSGMIDDVQIYSRAVIPLQQ